MMKLFFAEIHTEDQQLGHQEVMVILIDKLKGTKIEPFLVTDEAYINCEQLRSLLRRVYNDKHNCRLGKEPDAAEGKLCETCEAEIQSYIDECYGKKTTKTEIDGSSANRVHPGDGGSTKKPKRARRVSR